tara:strand:- start:1180 stop:1926 length:747 start_codon:yes stop_codon:yes gene_type:complete
MWASPYQNRIATGNVLFIILVAIALFSALSFVVGGSLGGGGKSASSENANLYAAEVLNYSSAIKSAVQMLRISNGCSETDISFENDEVSGYEHSPVARDECKVFHSSGGRVPYKVPPEDWLDTEQSANTGYQELYFPNSTCVVRVGTHSSSCWDDGGSPYVEMLLVIPYLKRDVCQEINRSLGFESIPQEWNNAFSYNSYKFKGVFGDQYMLDGDGSPLNDSSLQGCFEGNTSPLSGTYHYFHVLIAR